LLDITVDDANKYQTPLKLTSTKHNSSQARSYLYVKYTAAYTYCIDLSKKGLFKDVTICNTNLTRGTGRYIASLKQPN